MIEVIVIDGKSEDFATWIRVNMDGKPKMFGNGKQMFWRTAERAERYGK